MISQESFQSNFVSSIRRRIFLLIGRAILTAVTNSGKYQLIQVKGLEGETITDILDAQRYGFESYPKKSDDTEVVIIAPDGERDKSIAICVMDRRYRPTNLEEGEVQIYDFNGSKIYLKKDGTIRIEDKNGNFIKSTSTQWNVNDNWTVDK